MVVAARPDLLDCLIGRAMQYPEITTPISSAAGWQPGESGPRISASFQDGWKMPTAAIWLKRSGGPVGDYETGIKTTRVDARFYGPDGHAAERLWAIFDAVFCPGHERAAGFTLGGCLVYDIVPEADALADRERDTRYPYVLQPYIVTWMGVPVG